MDRRMKGLHGARVSVKPSAVILEEIRIIRNVVGLEYTRLESELAMSCWVAYGYMRAFERTELFTQVYEALFRRYHEKYIDVLTADELLPIRRELAGNSEREITSLWRGRQHADAMGMPYEVFIGQAMEHMLIKEGHKKVPRPNQLYSQQPIAHVQEYWSDERRLARPIAMDDWDPRFRADHFMGELAQVRTLDAIEERVRKAPNPEITLGSYLVRRAVILEPEARLRVGDELVDSAIARAGPVPPISRVTPQQSVPACFGLPPVTPTSVCRACPMARLCASFVDRLDQEFIKACGNPDPKLAAKREDAAARKRKERRKKRELAGKAAGISAIVPDEVHATS